MSLVVHCGLARSTRPRWNPPAHPAKETTNASPPPDPALSSSVTVAVDEEDDALLQVEQKVLGSMLWLNVIVNESPVPIIPDAPPFAVANVYVTAETVTLLSVLVEPALALPAASVAAPAGIDATTVPAVALFTAI